MKCKQNNCNNFAIYRYTWPGKDESFICAKCAIQLKRIAEAMGLYLQLIHLEQSAQQ